MRNKSFYIHFSPGHGFQKNDILQSGNTRLVVLNPHASQTWYRKLFKKSNVEGFVKVKYYKLNWWQKLRIKHKIFNWFLFEAEALHGFKQTNNKAYLKIARLARIKTITLKKQLQ